MDNYDAEVTYNDGTEIHVNGSLQQVANWADNMIRASEQGMTINIRRVENGHKKH